MKTSAEKTEFAKRVEEKNERLFGYLDGYLNLLLKQIGKMFPQKQGMLEVHIIGKKDNRFDKGPMDAEALPGGSDFEMQDKCLMGIVPRHILEIEEHPEFMGRAVIRSAVNGKLLLCHESARELLDKLKGVIGADDV